MSKRNYERLPIEDFGRKLIVSGDLDPVYIALPKAIKDPNQIRRWLVAYICYYHCGVASFISEHEGAEFWRLMAVAAANEEPSPLGGRWPRGSERRHARGKSGIEMVKRLAAQYPDPASMFDFLADGPMDIASVIKRSSSHYLFGSWISFKVADLMDAVLGQTVDQNDVNILLYDTPRNSIFENWKRINMLPESTKIKDPDQLVEDATRWLAEKLSDLTIPHKPGKPLDLFSLETVWCKHASHMHGHYPLFNDIDEIKEGLVEWMDVSHTADIMIASMPDKEGSTQ